MLYRTNPKNGDKISQLGFGCMRFRKKAGKIDQEKAAGLICEAIEKGVNYFDTAYIYPGSEQALGDALSQNGLRGRVKIASKLPIFICKKNQDFNRFFDAQLERLKTTYVDYYLIHMLCDVQTFERLKSIGLIEWIRRKKEDGKIINIGFSFHGGRDEFKKLVDAYDWDFCQIQYNYFDEQNQAGNVGLKYASNKGLPVFVMEPLMGGRLADALPKAAKEVFRKADKSRSPADWGLRWLWNQPEVTMLMSGMNELSQLEENVKLASSVTAGSLSGEELAVYDEVLAAVRRFYKIPCTGCGYCMPCPQGIDIPTCFSCYNESFSDSKLSSIRRYMQVTGAVSAKQTYASKCKKCGKCEIHCPQKIEVSKRLNEVSRRIESFWFRPVFSLIRRIMGTK